MQGKNDEVLKRARAAKRGTELAPATPPEGLEIATVAGGCFWGERRRGRAWGPGSRHQQVASPCLKPRPMCTCWPETLCCLCRLLHPRAGLELAYQRVPGVVKTSVGYTAGQVPNPTYEEVCSGRTGHTEAVQVRRGTLTERSAPHLGWLPGQQTTRTRSDALLCTAACMSGLRGGKALVTCPAPNLPTACVCVCV